MRKVDDGEEEKKEKIKKKKKREKIMTFIVATNVVASRPPERRPTGTSHACAKNLFNESCLGCPVFNTFGLIYFLTPSRILD